jgi:hypothetical protein
LPVSGQYITGHGRSEGKPGDFYGDGDLNLLNKPYPLSGALRIHGELLQLGMRFPLDGAYSRGG